MKTDKPFHNENLPVKLNSEELGIILKLFPENSPYYTPYINLLKNWYICKIDNSDPVKLFLCENSNTIPDFFVMPVVSLGGVNHKGKFFDFTFFENSGDTVRIELSISENLKKEYSLARWQRGDNSPFGGKLRIVEINRGIYLLVLDRDSKKIWIRDNNYQANIILPVTTFYNTVLSIQNIKDPKIAFNFDLLFGDRFNDAVLKKALFVHVEKNKIPGAGEVKPENEGVEKTGFWKRLFK